MKKAFAKPVKSPDPRTSKTDQSVIVDISQILLPDSEHSTYLPVDNNITDTYGSSRKATKRMSKIDSHLISVKFCNIRSIF